MFRLKIFVRVQTFRRVPPVLPRNFCHPVWRIITVLIMMVMMIEVFRGEKEKLRVRSVSGNAVGTWSFARRRRITRWANFIFFSFIDSFFYWWANISIITNIIIITDIIFITNIIFTTILITSYHFHFLLPI